MGEVSHQSNSPSIAIRQNVRGERKLNWIDGGPIKPSALVGDLTTVKFNRAIRAIGGACRMRRVRPGWVGSELMRSATPTVLAGCGWNGAHGTVKLPGWKAALTRSGTHTGRG